MPGIIDLVKELNPKKHGWPLLIVIVLFGAWETFSPSILPKDSTCNQEVMFLQKIVENDSKFKDSMIMYKDLYRKTDRENRAKDTVIKAIHEAIKPYKHVLKKQLP